MLPAIQLPAHGVGGATDLPIPYAYAVVGAAWALAISFAVLAFAWKEPRLQRPEADVDEPPRRPWLAVLGLVLTAWFLGTLFLGPDDASNPGLASIYILVWVGLVPLALLAGHVWKDLSPWRSAQWLVGAVLRRPGGFVEYPERWGYWPAALGLFGFVWLELVSPDAGDVATVRTWVAAYVVLTVVAGVVFGPRWFDRGDPFDVYSSFVARLAPLVDRRRLVPHNPLVSLPHLPVRAGLVAVIAVLLGSTAFDSFSASSVWQRTSPSTPASTGMLLLFCAVVATAFWLASRATGGVSREARRALPGETAHTLVPIVVGYMFAHYLSYLAEGGQRAVIGLLQQIGLGDGLTVSYFLSEHPDVLAIYKVMFVVAGHVVAVVAAHDIALKVLPRAHRLTGQLAMLVLMVAYTFGGIYLLFSV
ncbi:hypothetical protein [Aeromicrobium sp. Leaf350]|uniref:hypothetical protein n=1 Tax=Aeromicrobium sp. Leaf350 TaxID=2876565 RepID=UPI001E5EDA9A|nr:hypothetical protein [Aeromicrobium sp. Leaf350]